MRESQTSRRARAAEIFRLLRAEYPAAKCELNWETPFQLLVAVRLSAQCTDERVNLITPALFARAPDPAAMAALPIHTLEKLVHSSGFFRAKARDLHLASHKILDEFGGEVPGTMRELISIPGVGRKSANVILETVFSRVEGVVVDTHVLRLAGKRLQLVPHSSPIQMERDLMKLLPRADWGDVGHLLVWHGRRVCNARRPNCAGCAASHLCPGAAPALPTRGRCS